MIRHLKSGQSAEAKAESSAQVRSTVGNREISFMTNRGDDRNRGGSNRTRHDFFIECPKVFDRAAAAPDYDYIDPAVFTCACVMLI